jgi:hypothetical protein
MLAALLKFSEILANSLRNNLLNVEIKPRSIPGFFCTRQKLKPMLEPEHF